jgi:glycosyltransferase involved in cell wall biosynthesis
LRLSVIVPCLNAEATIAQQLEALISQQFAEPWELIIADNGSTDRTIEIARTFEKSFADIRIISAGGSRQLAAHARNVGARAGRSDSLAFCDADDEVAPGWVASMVHALSSHDVVCGQFRFDKFNNSRVAKNSAQAWKDGLYKGRFLPGGGSGNFGIKRWLHETIGGFDECLPHAEDADYFWRLQLEGFTLHYEPKAIVEVRRGRIKPSLPYLYRRSRNRVASNLWSYKRYRSLGMIPPPTLKESFMKWLHILRKAYSILLASKPKRLSLVEQLTIQTGDLMGQVKGRLTNPCKPYWPGQIGKRKGKTG